MPYGQHFLLFEASENYILYLVSWMKLDWEALRSRPSSEETNQVSFAKKIHVRSVSKL